MASAAAEGESIVELVDVSYSYPDGTEAVRDVSLKFRRGEITSIAGPSGGGKTTLLKVIAGLLQPSKGRLELAVPEEERQPAMMVFQQETVLPWLTVAGNVSLFFRLRPGTIQQTELNERVEWLLGLAGLQDFAKAYPNQLSGGMKRRVAFLAAIAPLPHILLLDEPFSSLDEPTRISIHQEAFSIMRELNITGVLVTHDLGEAISLGDRVVILTRRPASVARIHTVDFGNHRIMLELRETPSFLEVYGNLWHDLREQISTN